MSRVAAIVAVTTLSIVAPLHASSYYSGYELLARCDDNRQLACIGYIAGVSDLTNALIATGALPRGLCIPDNASAGQLELVVVQYLRSRPQNLHYEASLLVKNALEAAFPCARR